MNAPEPYRQFLEAKIKLASPDGFEVDPSELNPLLKPHIAVAVRWMLAGGRRALFARFGMQKTTAHLECMRQIMLRKKGPTLITLPLGARLSFFNDAREFFRDDCAVKVNFIRTDDEIDAGAINITNVETIREGKIDPRRFIGTSYDEGDILRNMNTKTFWAFARNVKEVPLRFVATATPDPNDYSELLAYASYLDIMDVGQARTRFFKRNSEKADELTLHPHKEQEFWLWVASWALFLQRPSDLGPEFSDEGYELPALDVRWHEIPADHASAGFEKNGQGRLLRNAALGIKEATAEKRDSLENRVAKMMEIIREGMDAKQGVQSGIPCCQPGKAEHAVSREISREQTPEDAGTEGAQEGLHGSVPTEEAAQTVAGGTEGTQPGQDGALSRRSAVPGEDQDTAARSEQTPSDAQASGATEEDLRDQPAGVRSPTRRTRRRLRDLPDGAGDGSQRQEPEALRGSRPQNEEGSRDPLPQLQLRDRALQRQSGASGEGAVLSCQQWVIWCDLNAEQSAIERILDHEGIATASIHGSLELDVRENLLHDWWDRRRTALVSKPVILGSGLNLQQCDRAIFVGVGYKFKDFIQAVHRIYRYGQKGIARIDIIATEAEREVVAALKGKWKRYEEQSARMAKIVREYGLARTALGASITRTMGVARKEEAGERFRLINNDCVEETRNLESCSVDLIVSSLPFSTQYEYTPTFNDFGHTDDDPHFFEQMDFLTPELLRVLKPGRDCMIHCKDRIVEGSRTGLGFETVSPFADRVKAHFMKHGFAYCGTKVIATDVVRENNQTYRLGWTEQCKDGSRQGFGLPEYVHFFRKPQSDRSRGYADDPVLKDKETYTRGRWQLDANGFDRSSGNRLLTPAELARYQKGIWRAYKEHSLSTVYDNEEHVAFCDALDAVGKLPPDYAIIPVHSWHPDIWTDVTRMRTLNTIAAQKSREKHLCPLPFDIVDRLIRQRSMEGEVVFDPFAGLGTVPYCAILQGRRGLGTELNADYFRDSVTYCREAEAKRAVPSLFDLIEAEENSEPASDAGDASPAAACGKAGPGPAAGDHHASDIPAPAVIEIPNFLSIRKDRVVRDVVPDAPSSTPQTGTDCASSSFEFPDMPEFLRRGAA